MHLFCSLQALVLLQDLCGFHLEPATDNGEHLIIGQQNAFSRHAGDFNIRFPFSEQITEVLICRNKELFGPFIVNETVGENHSIQ